MNFTKRKPQSSYKLLLSGSLVATKNGHSRTFLDQVSFSYSNIYEKDPLSVDSKPSFSLPNLTAISAGPARINILWSDAYFIMNVVVNIVANISVFKNKYLKNFFRTEDELLQTEDFSQLKKSEEFTRIYKLSDCISLLPRAYVERFGESISQNYDLKKLFLLDVTFI